MSKRSNLESIFKFGEIVYHKGKRYKVYDVYSSLGTVVCKGEKDVDTPTTMTFHTFDANDVLTEKEHHKIEFNKTLDKLIED